MIEKHFIDKAGFDEMEAIAIMCHGRLALFHSLSVFTQWIKLFLKRDKNV